METLEFDPGYYKCVTSIGNVFVELSDTISSTISLPQKKVRFKSLYPKVLAAIEENVAFYLGCMLWAVNLKSHKGKEIVGNPCLEDKYDKEGSMCEIDLLLSYVTQGLNRDTKYYLGQTYTPDPLSIKILETYKEFLDLNEGFHKTKMTNDIVLPKSIKMPDENTLKEIVKSIHAAIAKNSVKSLIPLAKEILV